MLVAMVVAMKATSGSLIPVPRLVPIVSSVLPITARLVPKERSMVIPVQLASTVTI